MCGFVTFGSPRGGGGGARMGPHLGGPREPPKSRNVKKTLSTVIKPARCAHHLIVKRGPRRGRAGAPSGAKSRLPLFAISADFRDFHDSMRFPVISRNFHFSRFSGANGASFAPGSKSLVKHKAWGGFWRSLYRKVTIFTKTLFL